MPRYFTQDDSVRESRFKKILEVVDGEWRPRGEILDKIDLDVTDETVANKLTGLAQKGYIMSRKTIEDPRIREYRISREGAEWIRDNRVD